MAGEIIVIPIDRDKLKLEVRERIKELLPYRVIEQEVRLEDVLRNVIDLSLNWAEKYCRGVLNWATGGELPVDFQEIFTRCVLNAAPKYAVRYLERFFG